MATEAATTVSDTIKNQLDRAKVGLMEKPDSAFFTTIVFSLRFKWDNSQPTAYTDGTVLGFNSDFFMSMSPAERVGVLVHEGCHVAYLHPERLHGRDKEVFNDAADHVINLQLLARGFSLPSWVLADTRFIDMSAEQVYDILIKEKKAGAPQQPNKLGDLRQPEDPAQFRRDVEDILIRARIQSQMSKDKPGTIPGDIELFLDKLLNPKLPWTAIFRKYLTSHDKFDYSWKKPNRRHFPQYYLPSLYSESLDSVTFAVDISGSETDADFLRFVSEVTGVFRMMKPKKLTLIQWDHEIKSIHTIRTLKQLSEVKFKGRGGTNINPVLEWASINKPQLLVIFSDGEFDAPDKDYKGSVIWVIHDNPDWDVVDFGKTIHFSTKG